MKEKDENGSVPLLKACACGSYDLVCLLLSSGANCNIADKWRNSVYHMAARHGRDEILQLLINHGTPSLPCLYVAGDNFIPNQQANTQRSCCGRLIGREKLRWNWRSLAIMQVRTDNWLLHEAAEKGFLEVVKILIHVSEDSMNMNNGYNVRLRNCDKKLPLHSAAISKRMDVVRYLLELAHLIKGATRSTLAVKFPQQVADHMSHA
ncbi:ankyrin repeat protein [Ancylostoma duodenale]|uniref:Ankyrin repeat protein n=1 Tax=Ancylostoma duodenale TaxID=51022 RepID=A0A0C2GNR3_9BILA|nr:ankyrin repeat protein [Ancylostoma duodenale]